MTEGFEQHLHRVMQRWHHRLMLRLHPELRRLTDDRDRAWAIWYARQERPRWQRTLGLWAVWAIGPLVTGGAVVGVGATFGLVSRGNWLGVSVISAAAGACVAAVLMELGLRRSISRVSYRAMRISGHDVCSDCGYDLTGHPPRGVESRTCPECGCSVDVLERGVLSRFDGLEAAQETFTSANAAHS